MYLLFLSPTWPPHGGQLMTTVEGEASLSQY